MNFSSLVLIVSQLPRCFRCFRFEYEHRKQLRAGGTEFQETSSVTLLRSFVLYWILICYFMSSLFLQNVERVLSQRIVQSHRHKHHRRQRYRWVVLYIYYLVWVSWSRQHRTAIITTITSLWISVICFCSEIVCLFISLFSLKLFAMFICLFVCLLYLFFVCLFVCLFVYFVYFVCLLVGYVCLFVLYQRLSTTWMRCWL